MICPNLNNPEVKAKFDQLLNVVPEYAYYLWDKYQGEVPAKYYNLVNVISDFGNKSIEIKKIIDSSLPSEISSAVTIMEEVPLDVLGREDLFLSMKEILNQNGITDELLINWAGINKATIGNVKNFTSTKQLQKVVENVYTKKSKADYHIALKSHPLALESFNKWVKALEKYPVPFRDLMLTHAIKYLNPQRRSKYVLQLSEVALQNAYGIVVNKPHEANRIGKLYDQEVLSTLSDAVEHEPSASGKGYWVHIPNTPKKNFGFNTYEEFKKHTESQLKGADNRIQELEKKLTSEYYNDLVSKLEKLKNTSPVFYAQEPFLSREEADNYGFQDYEFVRVESSYSRSDNPSSTTPFPEDLGENYVGYYIHGYNTQKDKPRTKVIAITKEQAEEIWKRETQEFPMSGYSYENRQEIYRLEGEISYYDPKRLALLIEEEKANKLKLELKFNSISPANWDGEYATLYKTNVETLRKLSPSTWCTSGSMTEHYVENYDNYLLIVDGVTVAGIEAVPGSQGSSKRQVKEVTSRANNGIAPIDHLEDVIAFFEKHDLDLNNSSIKRAQQLKNQGKVDNYEDFFEYYQDPFDIDYELEPGNFDAYDDAEAHYHAELQREEAVEFARGLTSVEDTLNNLNEVFRGGYFSIFSEVPSIFRNDERVARAAVLFDPYSLKDIDTTVPYYEELAVEVLTRSPHIWDYLPEEVRNLPSLLQLYRAYQEEIDEEIANELPFSKTNTNLIQGYFDPKTDKVVVVASNVTEEEAPKVAIHEVAHRGMIRMAKDLGGTKELYKVLFNSEKELMKKLPELLRRTGHTTVENLVKDYGFSLETEDGKAKLLMELAARWAETLVDKPKPSWWKQFLTSIQQWLTKFTGKTLNEQEVNELVGGFVRYGSDAKQDNTMESRVPVQTIIARYLRQEISSDLIESLRNDRAFLQAKDKFQAREIAYKKIIDLEKSRIGGRKSIKMEGNYIFHVNNPSSKRSYTNDQLWGYASRTAKEINSRYGLFGSQQIAWVRQAEDGTTYVELDIKTDFADNIVKVADTIALEDTRAEFELIELQESLNKERAAIAEKLKQGNELIVDGEVLPLNGEFAQRVIIEKAAISEADVEKYTTTLNKLVSKFPGVVWKWDATIPGAGKIDMNTGVVLLNPYFINEETPWHEFGHILVRGIRQNNPELFESLKEEVLRLHEDNPTMSAKTLVESLYPDYHGDKFWEEVITTELGRQAADFTPKTGLFAKIKQFFTDLLSSLGMYGAEPRNLGDLVKSLHDPNAEFDFYPKSEELSDFMESRLLTPEQQDALTIFVKKDLNSPNEFQTAAEQIKLITEAITDSDMGRMIERNKYFGAEELRKSESLPAAGDILNKNKGRLVSTLTKEDVAEAVLDFAEYVRYMTIYLNSIQRHVNALQKATDIPPGKKLGDYHRAYLQAQSVKKQIDALLGVVASPDKGVFGPELRESIAAAKDNPGLFKNHPVAKALFWMQQSVNTIISEHEGLIQEPVLEELADYFKEASENLKTVYNADIDNFISRLAPDNYSVNGQSLPTDPNVKVTNTAIVGKGIDARVQVSFNNGTQVDYSLTDFTKAFKPQSQAVARLINKAGNLQTEFEKNVPTKDNIRKQLKDTNSAWFAAIDTASTTKNAGIQIIAAYLQGQDAEYRASLVGIRGELERLTDEVFEAQGPQLGGSIVDSKTFYKKMYREVPLYEVVDGKLVTDKIVLALNNSTDTIALRNRMTELKYIIDYSMNEIADLDPNDNSTEAQARRLAVTQKIEQASEQLKDFYAEYTERPFTDEYYQIQEQLPQDIRDRRNELYKAMAASRASFVSAEEVDYDDFQLLRSYQKELDDMESFYDTNGNLKPENSEGYRIAKAIYDWKSLRRANQVVEFPPLTQETQQLFEAALNKQKSELSAALAAATTQDERQAAYDNYNRWLDIYTRTIYKQEFYDERQAIIDQIQEILGEQGPQLKNAYESLFNLLLGKKDRDGHYKPSEINDDVRRTAKAIEEEIEKIKAIDKSQSPLSKDQKEDLKYLFAQLQDLQSATNSKYYEETVASIKASLRTQITTANPTLEVDQIERLVHNTFVNSQWFQDNHIIKTRYNKELEEMTSVYEPIYFWRVTVPNNPDYVEKEAPSFYWYTPRVSENFKNPNYSPGNTTFKNVTSGPYHNPSYANLTAQQQNVLEKVRAFYYQSQEGNYSKDKPGDVLPGVYKTGGENAIDLLSRRKNPFTNIFEETKNFVLGARTAMSDVEETTFEEELDAYGNPIERESRKLFMRYSKPLPIEQQSYDLLRSIGLYAESSARFKSLRNLQSTVLAMEEVYENLSGIKEGGVVRDLIDRQFYGKVVNSPKNKVGKILNAMMNVVGRLAGSKSLAYNLISAPVNQFTGYKNNLIFTKSNGLTYGNYLAAYKETFGLSYDFFTAHNQTGMQPIRMQIIDFFGGTQSNYAEDFTKLTNRGLRKYAKFWRAVGTYRDYTEYDIAAMTTFAFLDKYNVTADDGTVYKLKDAFELVDGVLSIKPNIQVSPAFLQKVREDIRLANYRAQGVYDKLGQPTIAKHALVRQVLFLKKWMPQHLKTEWGGGTIHYGSGVKTIGAHRAFGRFLQETFYENGKFWTGYQNLTAAERAGLEQFGLNYGAFVMFSNVIGMMSAYLNCEDDGEANWKDYFCFFAKKISNEVEGVFTIWGANEFLFTYLRENANGIGGFEKFGWSLFGPFSVFRKFADFDGGLYNTDPYYKYRSNSSKIDWDRTHPTQAGKPGLQVLAMELLGTKGLFLGLDPQSMDYQNRAFNSYMPKTYTKDLRTRYKENYGGVEIMKTRTVGGQLKAQYKKQQKELQKKIQAYTSSGREVPASVYEDLADLQVRFTKAVSEMDARGDTDKMYTPSLFRPYFLTREGLDITEEF